MKKTEFIPICEQCFTQNTIFRGLTTDELDELSYVKTCNFYKRNDVIYHEGNRTGGIYCVSSGIVKHYKTGIDGKEQIIRFSKKGDIFGFRSILSEEPACTSAKVIQEATICFVPLVNFINFIKTNSSFSMNVMKLSCKELGQSNQYILDIAQKNVRERLAEVLLLLKKDFDSPTNSGTLTIHLTRDELAGIVGTATESVIRLLSEFKKDKLIELNKREIKILDAKKLQKISDVF